MPFRQNAAFRGFQSAVLRLALLAFQGVSVTAQPVSSATAPELGSSQSSRPHPIMHPDFATREQWRANHRTLPHAAISAAVQHRLTASAQASLPTSTNLLPYMTFTPSAWDQGNCGSCWTFASTAMLEVAMAYNYGIKDQLSVQFFQDNTNSYSCLGGDLTMFTTWYNKAGILVPLSNAGAGYVDGATNQYCLGPLDNANNLLPSSKPNYPITLVTPAKIDNTTLNQSQMITAMKAAINQGQAIGFSFFTDFGDSGGFYDFWDNKPETALWTNPFDNATYNAASWGGHMVAIMGYDDSDPNPANNYWIVQNQWGVSTNRPNGQFRMPMTMDYAARLTDGVNTYFAYTFETLTLTMTPAAPAAPTVFVGAAPTGISQGQPLSTSAVVGQQLMMAAWVTGPPPFRYQWRKDGVAIPGATSGLYTIPYVNTTDGGHQYDVIATNASGSATAAAVSFVVNGQQLLLNPGFESGGSGAWTWSSTLPTAETNPFRTDPTSSYSHSGTWYSFLGYDDSIGTKNTGYLEQLVTIPAGAGTVTLSYWVQQITSQSDYTTIDTLTMHVTDAQGNILKTLNTYKTQDWDHILWTQDSFDLSDFRGQTVMVRADWSEKATNMTAWRLDDFALTFNPVITPTPTLFPKAATVAWGGSQAFTPIVANGTANTVTWSAGGTVPTGTTLSGVAQTYLAPSSGTSDIVIVSTVDTPVGTTSAAVTLVSPSVVTVTVNPSVANVLVGSGSQQFTATVSPISNGSVIWTGPGVNASGLFSAAGLATGNYTVTATSTASPTSPVGTASVTVVATPPPAVSVALAPAGVVVMVYGGSQSFTPTITNGVTNTVTWTSDAGGVVPAGATASGTAQTYTAPARNGYLIQDTVTVRTVDDSNISSSTTVALVLPTSVGVAVSPKTALLGLSDTQLFTATVSTITNGAVTWRGAGVNASGLFSAAGLAPGTYNITATSVGSPTSLGSAIVTVANATPGTVTVTVSPATVSLPIGGSQQFAATVSGITNGAVNWSGTGMNASGLFSAVGLAAGTYNVTATSVASPTSPAGTAVVTVLPTTPAVVMDLNGDGAITPLDLLTFATYYGTTNSKGRLANDRTTVVDDADLAALLAQIFALNLKP